MTPQSSQHNAESLNPFMTEADHIEASHLLRKSMGWFVYNIGLRHERVKDKNTVPNDQANNGKLNKYERMIKIHKFIKVKGTNHLMKQIQQTTKKSKINMKKE